MRLRFEEMAHAAAKKIARVLRESNTTRLFGFDLQAVEPGRAVVRMRVRKRHRQVHGVVHGGILAALADTTGALGCYLSLPRGAHLATVEMKINYLEPVVEGVLYAEGKMLRLGKTFTVAECEIRDEANRLVAKSLLTFAIVSSTKRGKRRNTRK